MERNEILTPGQKIGTMLSAIPDGLPVPESVADHIARTVAEERYGTVYGVQPASIQPNELPTSDPAHN